MSHTSEDEYDADIRSGDEDSEGSLVDFIVDDETDGEEGEEEEEDGSEEEELNESQEASQLNEEFPFDRSLLEETSSTGPRRSRRARKQVERYVDDKFADLFCRGEDLNEISEALGEEDAGDGDEEAEDELPQDDDDEDYVGSSEDGSEDEEDEEDEEEDGGEDEEEKGNSEGEEEEDDKEEEEEKNEPTTTTSSSSVAAAPSTATVPLTVPTTGMTTAELHLKKTTKKRKRTVTKA
jgi:hypothetical protein